MYRRGSGLLLHVSSLPSPFGIGDLGPSAYRFADLLFEARQSYWQVLPINPTSTFMGNSPYNSDSAFAGNPLLISPELLEKEGLLSRSDLDAFPSLPARRVDYEAATLFKKKILHRAYESYQSSLEKDPEFAAFCKENAPWLEDYALLKVLKEHFNGVSWNHFPAGLMNRDKNILDRYREAFKNQILSEQFLQFIFFKQWFSLKNYCNRKNIRVIGDIPIYVQYNSADIWTHPGLFHLDPEGRPWIVAGVPPDYFSNIGQLWGNPLYNWEALKTTRYAWWIERLSHNLKLFDLVRLDHFRGFAGYWQVPAGETTAEHGTWAPAPAEDFFKTLFSHNPDLPVIAEDLGVITPDVVEIMNRFRIPGMKLLVFAFGDNLPVHPYAPHNYAGNCLVYTGTHDTNTARGWFTKEASPGDRERLSAYLGKEVNEESIPLELIRLAMMSVANTVIIPVQDLLGLGEEARMNLPGTTHGNWEWRLLPDQLTPLLTARLAQMTLIYGRTGNERIPGH
ncbi:MAG: 4-alpha-glucanotransferase [Nitrospirae bacterium]|nr:4-alpha-glucanotransferase [Nitrospirota bacterium]